MPVTEMPEGSSPASALALRSAPASQPLANGTSSQFLSQMLPLAHLIDTLPYVDALTPEQNEEAKSLIQQELVLMNRERQARRQGAGPGSDEDPSTLEEEILKEYLDELLPPPKTPHLDNPNSLVGKELLRIKRGEPMQKLDLTRLYEEAPAPPKSGETAEWRKSIATCESLLEHLSVGQTNLDLMNIHAISSWTRHLQGLMAQGNHWESALKRVRTEVDGVSKARKLEQVECGNALRNLNRTREDYEARNREIMGALSHLNEEVAELKHKCRVRGLLPEDWDSDVEEEEATWAVPIASAAPGQDATSESQTTSPAASSLPLSSSASATRREHPSIHNGSAGDSVASSSHAHSREEDEMVDYD
ncbi:Breast carcinoma amplified sequence 2, related [Neospora caninum Liverpool]|uniref:Breast carcinoma amplified sequence 2, related n=1 Tax=Neospora caninum (strain Liverpool) TaxID=572307 RepID=F0VEA0_NEOCL|nr:Breast carcinoma amplified sequence 2, related [Neospora caninum Liverpool]CBZ52044.1 Breast carcinoma amplified sequence 2, related [Neospora caninum Liverpool]CEL66005.1 TPA: Breast carcinoma amplified sequence 2, related [Neospora caninum Liverpool]|eukprot:XP_003882076.1 Breast carcinoma amplified sequence 2, related [Neospora caninum Liverpool]